MMSFHSNAFGGLLLSVVWATTCGGQVLSGYGDYTAWADWARIKPGVRAGLASSYDRAGGNLDFSHYESPSGLVTQETPTVVRTIQGPGIIYRFWMPHLTAKRNFVLKMYFDEEATPRIDTTSLDLLGGSFSYISPPLLSTFAGGQVCYEPIPFGSSLRIETVNLTLPENNSWSSNRHYYQYSYVTFPPSAPIDSYDGQLDLAEQQARAETAALFSNAGQHPTAPGPLAEQIATASMVIPADGLQLLADITGPGRVRRLHLALPSATDVQLDALHLRVTYDEQPVAAIDVPVALFFGAGHQRTPYRSLPLGTDSAEGFYCYFPMPFHRRVRIELLNTGDAAALLQSGLIEYEPGRVEAEMGYLHARASATSYAAGSIYHPMLNVSGCGHYVGNLLYTHRPEDIVGDGYRMLEGDDVITVDGTDVLHGTGLEDAYNGGYYYNWVGIQNDEPEGARPQSAIRPLSGLLYMNHVPGLTRVDQYRWQIADRVAFTRSIDVKVEIRYETVPGSTWTSVAFWYQHPGVRPDFDGDCDVDLDDFCQFQDCQTGPGLAQVQTGCEAADLEDDGDVDQADFGVFQRCISGPDRLADPACE